MKKIVFILIFLISLCSNAGAWQRGSVWEGWEWGGWEEWDGMTSFPNGLTFLADYSSDLDADFSRGSPTATFTRTGGATKPATYFDSSGVMQKTVVTDDPRYNHGYYDATGWHAFTNPGVLIEGASTNLIAYSYSYQDATWTASNVTVADGDIDAPDGTTNASTFTASAGNGTVLLAANTGTDAQTYSVFLKRKTGIGTISITADSGGNYTTVTLSTDWRRFTVTATAGTQKCGIKIATNTDAIYVWGSQFENIAFATSFIPTVDAALTRNAETLKYEIAGNRTAAMESCVVKFVMESASGLPLTNSLTDTDTKRRYFRFRSTDDVGISPNYDDSGNCYVTDIINEAWTANTEMTLGYAIQHSSPYIAGYFDGVVDGTNETADDFTDPAWGTYFWVGSDKDGVNQLYGTIFSIAFFNKVLSAEEMLTYHNRGWFQ